MSRIRGMHAQLEESAQPSEKKKAVNKAGWCFQKTNLLIFDPGF